MKLTAALRLPRRREKKVNRSLLGSLAMFALLAAIGAFMALPLVFAISNAFKPLDEMFLFPPRFLVRNPTLTNFSDLFNLITNSWVPFSRYMFNTLFITVCGTVGHVLIASAAAYPMAKHEVPGTKPIFRMIVLSLMFSTAVTSIPVYLIVANLGWIDSYASLIVPAWTFPLGLYLMKQFMEQIPDALLEAAKIDGAGEYRVFWQIVMPLVKPAWLTLVILLFQQMWAADGGNFIYSEQLKTMHYALGQIMQGGLVRAGAASAAMFLLMSVPIALFIVSQSNIIQTMASSGMKD